MQITKSELEIIEKAVKHMGENYVYTAEQRDTSYQQWNKGANKWGIAQQGGTGIMKMLQWYHHRYKPGSKEWRPTIIIKAVIESYGDNT